MLAKFMAQQLGAPSGLVGRWVLAPLWNRRNSALNDLALDRLALHAHDRVLEVGFGGGYLLGRMAGVVTQGCLAGVDASRTMVSVCERRYRSRIKAGRIELRCAPAEALPYSSGRFSKACSVNSLFYWADAPRAMAEICRVLEAGGRLVLCVTRKRSIEGKRFARHGLGLYEDEEVCTLMEGAGFAHVEMNRASDRHREFLCLVGLKPCQATQPATGPDGAGGTA